MQISRVLIGVLAVAAPTVVSAQQTQRSLLDQAEIAVTSGIFADARALLDEWRRANPSAARADQEAQARYHWLSARVTTNADSAEDNYLTIAVNYPTSRVAPDALVRLAQARRARGDAQQAIAYLQRVMADYPSSDQRALAAVWLSRLQSGAAGAATLCELLRGVNAGSNVEMIDLLKAERTRVCNAPKVAATIRPPPRPAPQRDTTPVVPPRVTANTPAAKPVTSDTTRPTQPPAAGSTTARVAVQVGAFRELSGARAVLQQLQRAGYADARLVRVPGNSLIRVRVGRFANGSAAAPMLARLAAADISAVLVTDVLKETPVRDQ